MKGSGRLREESLDLGRPPRSWFCEHRENSRSKERRFGSHPSMKPLAVCERLVRAHSNEWHRVVISFAGSGSEMIACAKLGRVCIGFECDRQYATIAQRRLQSHGVTAVVKDESLLRVSLAQGETAASPASVVT